jgi:hypothetical protein
MKILRSTSLVPLHRLAPVLCVLLLAALFAGGMHTHADGAHASCAVCTASHSAAVATTAVPPIGPATQHFVGVASSGVSTPRAARLPTAPSRAPPSA